MQALNVDSCCCRDFAILKCLKYVLKWMSKLHYMQLLGFQHKYVTYFELYSMHSIQDVDQAVLDIYRGLHAQMHAILTLCINMLPVHGFCVCGCVWGCVFLTQF